MRDTGAVAVIRGIDDRQRVQLCLIRPFPICGEIGKTCFLRFNPID